MVQTQVLDVLPGQQSGFGWTSDLKTVRGSLYFTATDGRHGVELYRL